MMRKTENFDYFESDTCQAVKLLYRDVPEASMLVILPKDGYATTAIDKTQFGRILANLSGERVELSLPKFNLEQEIDLKGPLKTMGIQGIFRSPDFTPLVDLNHEPSKAALGD